MYTRSAACGVSLFLVAGKLFCGSGMRILIIETRGKPGAWLLLCVFGFLALFLPRPVTAQDSTYVLPQITVTATRLPSALLQVPMRLTVLDAKQSTAVADLLSDYTTLYIRRYGSGLASISQRGAGASQTAVLLDGHSIASPQLGQVDLSLLPTIVLSSVEIVSGTGASMFGTGAMAGVVNLRTGASPTGIEVRTAAGSFGRRTGAFIASTQQGRIHASLAAELYGDEGDYEYVSLAHFPPRAVSRRGGDQRRNSIYGTLRWGEADRSLRLAGWLSNAERGLPSVHTFQHRRERQWDRHARLWVAGERPLGRATLQVSGLLQRGMLRYVNPMLLIDDTGRTVVSSFDAEIRTAEGAVWQIGAGISAGYARARHPRLEAHQWRGAAFMSATGTYGPLRLYPALRLDYYAERQAVNPRLGANLRVAQRLHVKVSAGRAFRMPTFNDLYWRPGGNPDLLPERGWSYDMGARWQKDRNAVEVSAFASLFTNQIVWQPTSEGYWSPANVERLLGTGMEASGTWQAPLVQWLDVRVRSIVSFTDSRIPGANGARRVRLVPRNQLKTHVEGIAGPWTVGISTLIIGERAVTIDDAILLPQFAIMNATLSLHLGGTLTSTTLTLRTNNALNVAYEYTPNSPMPPRMWQLECILKLY